MKNAILKPVMELYRWQQECLEKWIANQTHGIADVITGAGKTTMALACAGYLKHRVSNLRVRIVVPTIPLARQWKKAILQYFPDLKETGSISLYYGEQKDTPDRPFTIYVINSARYALSRHILNDMSEKRHVFLICDECHRYTGSSNSLIFRFQTVGTYDPSLYHSLGLSATPQCERLDSILVPALGKLFYRYDARAATKDGIISPFHIINVRVPLNGNELKEYGELTNRIAKQIRILLRDNISYRNLSQQAFYAQVFAIAKEDSGSLEAALENTIRLRRTLLSNAESRQACVIDLSRRLAEDETEKFLIFTERIEQAETLYEQLKQAFPGRTGHYHSDMTAEMKRHCLSMFREGEYRFLVTCRALDEGLDVPDATTAIVVSSGSLSRQRIQRLGRILRRSKQKPCAKLYYFYVPNTVEHRNYLDGLEAVSEVINMQYLPSSHSFLARQYESAVSAALQDIQISTSAKEELMRCIEYGLVRTDWLLPEELLSPLIHSSVETEIRNYYYCMSLISNMRLRMQTNSEAL